jgi:hypothetical protein
LLRYDGLTNIRDLSGDYQIAVIEFPQRARRSVTAVDLERLRSEPLVERCPASG